jgi:apolipoprotein N-acyltransferase
VRLRGLLPARRHLTAAALTAVALFVAYPPFGLVVPAFVALVPFLWCLEEYVAGVRAYARTGVQGESDRTPARRHGRTAGGTGWAAVMRTGYWFGALTNGLVFYWLVVALWHFTPLALAGYLAAVLIVLAPGWLLFALAYVWVRRRTGLPVWLVFPLLWTALEWLVGHQGDLAFPWLSLGVTLTRVPVLVQFAELGGARGVTLWLAAVNALLYLAIVRRRWRPAAVAALSVALALGYGLWRMATIVERPLATAALLQPNVGFDEKQDAVLEDRRFDELLRQAGDAARRPGVQLVVTPETALPGLYFDAQWRRCYTYPGVQAAVRRDSLVAALARGARVPLLVGAVEYVGHPDCSYDYYNAAFFYDSAGDRLAQPSYRKHDLVPITERVPFLPPRWFGGVNWFGGFSRGDRTPVYRFAQGGFGVLICYESIFEDLSRRYRREGADFLVNITNDGWFGTTVGPYQHAAHLVMRAIETRAGVARAANTGVSEFVDPLGRAHQATPLEVPRTIAGPVFTTSIRTPYVRFGDWVGALALAGTAALFVAASVRRRSPGVPS